MVLAIYVFIHRLLNNSQLVWGRYKYQIDFVYLPIILALIHL